MSPAYGLDLGGYRRATSSGSARAREWWDRGIVWSYAFHHEEAIACFRRAIAHDPEFGLAHWGVAYATGPNYNKGWDAFEAEELRASLSLARSSLSRAGALAAAAGDVERALIEALGARYPADADGELERRHVAYADAMADVYARFADDLDVVALYADALLNVTAWQLWDLRTGEPAPGARTLQARAVLERGMGLAGGDRHPGLLHLYIHLMEMSREPEAALPAADALRELVPDAGHLVHMPTHIDVLLGDYARVIAGNERAVAADDRWVRHVGAGADAGGAGAAAGAGAGAGAGGSGGGAATFYTLYRAHNHHFRIYGAMFAGRRADALRAADDLVAILPESLLRVRSPPMADWLESFVGMRLHVMIRFGMWEELIALALPDDASLYRVTTALTHYARGVALAATGRVTQARAARAALAEAVALVPDSRYLFNNTAADILAIAAAMLDGEIAYRAGDLDRAWRELSRAIELDDTLPYDEPWGWMQPTRHAYGALLLEQGEAARAAQVYAADLGLDDTLPRALRHPGNVWSLHGYHECLIALGRHEDAHAIMPALSRALAGADVEIRSSCFCRMGRA